MSFIPSTTEPFQILTTHKPTKCGFYFIEFRGTLSGKICIGMAKLYNNKGWEEESNTQPNTVFWDGENMRLTDDRIIRYGASPIPQPVNKAIEP